LQCHGFVQEMVAVDASGSDGRARRSEARPEHVDECRAGSSNDNVAPVNAVSVEQAGPQAQDLQASDSLSLSGRKGFRFCFCLGQSPKVCSIGFTFFGGVFSDSHMSLPVLLALRWGFFR
jgi:hypothetical protein